MKPDQLNHCLLDIGWSDEILAQKLECHVSLVEAWLSGDAEIPPKAAAWITALAAFFTVTFRFFVRQVDAFGALTFGLVSFFFVRPANIFSNASNSCAPDIVLKFTVPSFLSHLSEKLSAIAAAHQ